MILVHFYFGLCSFALEGAEKGLTQANVAIAINKPYRSWGTSNP
jgi:hypothetical protein